MSTAKRLAEKPHEADEVEEAREMGLMDIDNGSWIK